MPRKMTKSLPGYYSPGEAMKRLGIADRDLFHSIVRKYEKSKRLKPIRPAGVKMYPISQIEVIRNEIALLLLQQEDEPTEVRIAQPEDAQGIYDVLAEGFGWNTAPVSLRLSWYKVNPLIDYVVLSQSKIAGYISATPYIPQAMDDRMSGKREAWNMLPEDIYPYEPGNYDVFVGIAVRQDMPKPKWLAFRLIAGWISFLEELAKEGIRVRRFYAVSDEVDGQRLCDELGFIHQVEQKGDKFPRYVLDLETSDSHFARRYRESIKQ